MSYKRSYSSVVVPEDFGQTDTANDGPTLQAMFTAVASRPGTTVHLPGQYTTLAQLNIAAANINIVGVPGYSRIRRTNGGAADRAVAYFSAGITNVNIDGITFDTTYTDATYWDPGVVYTATNTSITNASFRRCTFSAPNSNQRGLMLYANTGGGSVTTIDGLWIEKCVFQDIGNLGCAIFNRSADPSNARRVYFNQNRGKNLGLILDGNVNHEYGMLATFDGCGESWTADNNEMENCYYTGLENTGWSDGSMSGNRFRGFSREWSPMAWSNAAPVTADPYARMVVSGNVTEEPASKVSRFWGPNDSAFTNNVFLADMATGNAQLDAAAWFRASNRNIFTGNRWECVGTSVVVFGTGDATGTQTTDYNSIIGDSYTTPALVSYALEFNGFDAASVTENFAADIRIDLGAGGGAFTENSGATGNNATVIA